jgi:D-alanine transaminase
MAKHVWDGERLLERDQASVDIEDRGFTFGDGVYEVFRVYSGQIFEAKEHWQRLARSAKELRIDLPYTAEFLHNGVMELMKADGLNDGMVYLQLTRGAAPRAHAFPPAGTKPTLTVFTKILERPTAALQDGIAAITHPDIRWLRCDIKSLNLLPNVLAKQAASEVEAAEAVLHRDGVVTEGSSSNVAIIKDGVLLTHPANHLILPGITRTVVLRLAGDLGLPVKEEPFTTAALLGADEAFVLSTNVEIMPVVRIDGTPIGDGRPGPVTRRLQQAYTALLQLS